MRVFLLMLTLLVAGCAGPAAETENDVSDVATEGAVITDPKDFSYLDDPNDPGAHRHDYWGGKDNLTIMDEVGPSRSASCSGSAGACRMDIVSGRPADGVVIPQGTQFVDIRFFANLNQAENVDFFAVFVKTAQQSEMEEVGRIAPGQWFRFNSTNDDNDVPHNTLSLWQFAIKAGTHGDSLRFSGQGEIEVIAHRGLEIPLFPSHPDLWQGKDELLLTTQELSGEERRQPTGWSCSNGMCREFGPDDGMIVPFGASAVHVIVDYGVATPNAALSYSGSNTWSFTTLQPEPTDDPLQDVFIIETPLEMTDSPYAKQSLWAFELDAGEIAGGVGFQRGDVTVTVKAIR